MILSALNALAVQQYFHMAMAIANIVIEYHQYNYSPAIVHISCSLRIEKPIIIQNQTDNAII